MSSETEIKLDLSQDACGALLGSDLLGEPDRTLQQRSTYFDTPERTLWKQGYSLRIRKVGDARTQTVKATGPSRALFARSEWEIPVEGDEPVLDHTSPLIGEFGEELRLEPVFDVVVERRLWNVDENGSRIEVVVDQGEVISGERRSPIRELEIELKDGSPGDLFALARKVDAIAAFRFGVISKSERGFLLIDAQKTVFKSEPIYLDRGGSPAFAFQSVALSCLRHFRLNEDVFMRGGNPEALHQARVALRRLRSAFSLFKPILENQEPQWLKDELRWLAGVLGEARNVDVLLAKAVDPDFIWRLKTARKATYRDALDALESSRTRALMLDVVEWLQCGDYLSGGLGTGEASDASQAFAAGVLEKQRKRLKKDGRALKKLDDQDRHEIRKDAKKFRYAAEFFASLSDDKRSARRHSKFLKAMEALQDQLGALNDLVTEPDVLNRHGLSNHPAADTVMYHGAKGKLIDAAQDALDEVLDTKRFWRL